jgi:L-ascorbate metabolism protein UlaG (beta-lactamase superfamily)
MNINAITFLGHASAALHYRQDSGEEFVVLIDPWLEGNPLCPPAWYNPKGVDAIVVTHGHFDHASQASSLAKKYGATIFSNWELCSHFKNEGVPEDRVQPLNRGGTVSWQGLQISLTIAFHSSAYETAQGVTNGGEPCGAVISDGRRAVYHTGDTALFSDMKLIAEQYQPEVALICCGDRFTMGPVEAARAASFLRCKTAIPIHHSTFDLLSGTPEQFSKACGRLAPECNVAILGPGQRLELAV